MYTNYYQRTRPKCYSILSIYSSDVLLIKSLYFKGEKKEW